MLTPVEPRVPRGRASAVTGRAVAPRPRWPAAPRSPWSTTVPPTTHRAVAARARHRTRRGARRGDARPPACGGVDVAAAQPRACPTAIPSSPRPTAAGVPVRVEFDLAAAWDDRPVVAITGTNGKTTVTTLVTDDARGVRAACGGRCRQHRRRRWSRPSTTRPSTCSSSRPSSFRLGHTAPLRARRGGRGSTSPPTTSTCTPTWRPTRRPRPGSGPTRAPTDVAVANADDPVVMATATPGPATVTFGLGGGDADYRVDDGRLVPARRPPSLERRRAAAGRCPTTSANALAAAATALEPPAPTVDGVRAALRRLRRPAPPGRSWWARPTGSRWYDDSKATTPHATRAAVDGFDSVVLIAGGPQQGPRPRRRSPSRRPPVRAVVAIGEAAADVVDAVRRPRARSATAAIDGRRRRRGRRASPGRATPCCCRRAAPRSTGTASYGERGDDFAPSSSAATGRAGRRRAHEPSNRRPATRAAAPAASGRRPPVGRPSTTRRVPGPAPPAAGTGPTRPPGDRSSTFVGLLAVVARPEPARPGRWCCRRRRSARSTTYGLGLVPASSRQVDLARASASSRSSSSMRQSTTAAGGAWRTPLLVVARRAPGRSCSCPASASRSTAPRRWLGCGLAAHPALRAGQAGAASSSSADLLARPRPTTDRTTAGVTLRPVLLVLGGVAGPAHAAAQPRHHDHPRRAIVLAMLFVGGVAGPLAAGGRRRRARRAARSPSSSRLPPWPASWPSSTRGPTRPTPATRRSSRWSASPTAASPASASGEAGPSGASCPRPTPTSSSPSSPRSSA